MAKLGMFFKTLGTKIATLWKTTTWFKIASIGGAVVIATSAVVIPNAVISETGGIFHKCDFSIESIDTEYSYSVANCTEKAKYYYSCACGKKGTDLFEYGNPLGHDLTHHASKQVTCTDVGYDEYDTCSRCDYSTYEEIPATGHTNSEWITDADATCTEDGSKHQICSVCNDTIETAIIPATGHTDGEWITDAEATCTEDGSKHQICSTCNDTIKTAVIPATGHTDGDWITDAEATCTEDGSKHQICSTCNDTINTAVIPATGHTDGDWITDAEATCTEDGSKHQICSVCNDTIKTTVIPATGHTDGEWITDVNATCTENGNKHQICSVCNDTINTAVIPATGHKYAKTVTKATLESSASILFTCDTCMHSYTEIVSPINVIAELTGSGVTISGSVYYSRSFEVTASGGFGRYQYRFEAGSNLLQDYTTDNTITVYGNSLIDYATIKITVMDEIGQKTVYEIKGNGSYVNSYVVYE